MSSGGGIVGSGGGRGGSRLSARGTGESGGVEAVRAGLKCHRWDGRGLVTRKHPKPSSWTAQRGVVVEAPWNRLGGDKH